MKYENFKKAEELVNQIDELIETKNEVENASLIKFEYNNYNAFLLPIDINRQEHQELADLTEMFHARVITFFNEQIIKLKTELEKL